MKMLAENLQNDLVANLENVEVLEQKMLTYPQEKCDVFHNFGPGIYMREVHLPKGALVVGHHHKFEHMNIFLKGKITFFGENGPIEMKAPVRFVGKPGRKIAYIHEDSVWINVFATHETDVERLEDLFLIKSDAWIKDKETRGKVDLLKSKIDEQDFQKAISEFGFSKDQVSEISRNEEDLTSLPYGDYKIKVGNYGIHGKGLFATADIKPDEIIAPARISGKRTIAGRFTNHSSQPNAKMIPNVDGDILLIAIHKISGCQGGRDGDEITINYREALKVNLEIGGKEYRL